MKRPFSNGNMKSLFLAATLLLTTHSAIRAEEGRMMPSYAPTSQHTILCLHNKYSTAEWCDKNGFTPKGQTGTSYDDIDLAVELNKIASRNRPHVNGFDGFFIKETVIPTP